MNRFILIDGNAIVHRAFHGLPPLTTPNGDMVNAVYGFFSMLLKIHQDYKPDHLIVCFDRPTPTFRKQLYVGYQATRPALAEGLSPQFGMIRETLVKAKIPVYDLDGYEADDLIGTLARQIVDSSSFIAHSKKEKNHELSTINNEPPEVIIFSGDRDLLQLVNSHVKMLAPVTGISNMAMFDEQKVEEKYGLEPLQIIDYKALVGDPSDNYPGVQGIGPKTASSLLRRFKTLEGVYEHLGEIEGKVGEKLATDAEQAALCKKLATIITDAPIHLDAEASDINKIDYDSLKKSFEGFGFNSLLKRWEANGIAESNKRQVISDKKKEEEKKAEKKDDEQLGLL